MKNIYDDEKFSKDYDHLRFEEKGKNANDLIEIPNFKKIMPDVKDKTILDLGCGYGIMDKYYKELGAKEILGIDISSHMIEIANKEYKLDGIEYMVMPMEEISNLDKKFDIVMSSLAFHYVENYEKLIKDIYNLLNDNGVLVFSIEHPMTTCFKPTKNIKKSHIEFDNKYYGLFSDYNREGERIKKWNDRDVTFYHRNMETIINTLIKNEFKINKIMEPKPSEEAVKIIPKYIYQFDRPYFLFIRTIKE